ncbi:MAG: M15 family metallopeptidase [Prevotellaceae bacterium]|jgi:D-alanyl-D-alanine dipeptidase|nr:M15 family metallopeptidase [Prevotellaceae bacterium]
MKKFVLILLISQFALTAFCQQSDESQTAKNLQKIGLVNIKTIDKTIVVDLKYATTDNFTGKNLYGDFCEACLQPEVAKMLANAQKKLKEKHANWSIVIYDAVRPRSVQQKMWEVVKNTDWQKYVSSPSRISMHSYGVAVDVGIVDEKGNAIDMGTGFDEFTEKSQPRHEQKFLLQKQLTQQQINNRLVLRNAMKSAGFRSIQNEWWHFEAMTREQAQQKYKPID